VFFSFHFERDIFRVNQVRNSNVVAGANEAGFFDHSEYVEAKKKSVTAIRRLIAQRLDRTTVTVILIGKETANRKWVREEIAQSFARRNGFLGIYIHHLKDMKGESSWFAGPEPHIPGGVPFPTYKWDKDLDRFSEAIEAAALRAEAWRKEK
jgi:hypothetical protein